MTIRLLGSAGVFLCLHAIFGCAPTPDVQQRVTGSCASGSAISAINADGTVSCEPDDGGASYSAGAGLALSGENAFSVSFAGSGNASTAARSDHNHAGTYLPVGPESRCQPGQFLTGIEPITGMPECQPQQTWMAGAGISIASGTVTNTGVLSVSASGGATASTSNGVVSIQAAAPSGDPDYIHSSFNNQFPEAQATNMWLGGMMRMGSETGTSEGPDYPVGTSGVMGIITRRIRTTDSTSGSVVARTNFVEIIRDGTSGGLAVKNTSSIIGATARCFTMSSSGTVAGAMLNSNPNSTTPLFDDLAQIVYAQCLVMYSHSNAQNDSSTEFSIARSSFATPIWSGFLTSTVNQ